MPTTATANHLIATLPAPLYAQWERQLQAVDLRRGDVLHESGRPITHVYFPVTCTLSMLQNLANGASAEVAIVGKEGMVGLSAIMGGRSMPHQAVVRSAGQGFRLPVATLVHTFEQDGAVAHLLLRFTQAVMTQIGQTAACNRHHTLDQQLCRLLLVSLDRLDTPELWMTHELIANLLGVRREGVTEAALNLQKAALIHYSRGHITVLNRPALEQRSCECYAAVKREYDRLMRRPLAGLTSVACWQ